MYPLDRRLGGSELFPVSYRFPFKRDIFREKYTKQIIPHAFLLSSFLGSTAQLRPWPPPQNPAEFLGGFSTIFFFTG
jgi:hypothetical protein